MNEFIPIPCNLIGFGHLDGNSQSDFYLVHPCSSSSLGTLLSVQDARSSPKLLMKVLVGEGSRMSIQ